VQTKFLSPPHAESALRRSQGVISLDLGWSPAVENQVFDHVHRLGQQRDITVQRLVIMNTVEGRILMLQNRKVLLKLLAHGSLKVMFCSKIWLMDVLVKVCALGNFGCHCF
jgi:hypothetical protein